MCTLTWIRSERDYELRFNRDEQRGRPHGLPPRRHEKNGVLCLAPIDPLSQGTWLSVNEFGVSVCVINQYPEEPLEPEQPVQSRGHLVQSLAHHASASALLEGLTADALRSTKPFQLFAMDLHTTVSAKWDSRELVKRDKYPTVGMLTSSSFRERFVVHHRQRLFGTLLELRLRPSANDLNRFHLAEPPAEIAYAAVNMFRRDARTVSYTHVRADLDGVRLDYFPKPGPNGFVKRPHSIAIPLRRECVVSPAVSQTSAKESANGV